MIKPLETFAKPSDVDAVQGVAAQRAQTYQETFAKPLIKLTAETTEYSFDYFRRFYPQSSFLPPRIA